MDSILYKAIAGLVDIVIGLSFIGGGWIIVREFKDGWTNERDDWIAVGVGALCTIMSVCMIAQGLVLWEVL